MGAFSARLDKLLVDRGLVASRDRAQALVLAAKILVNGQCITKAGQQVPTDSSIQIIGEQHPFVSRGGVKLQHAFDAFGISATDLVAMDVGASTGGFTDCLLSHGARRVYAVDVGYGQLAWKLRNDQRVIVLERQNIRHISSSLIPEPIQIATVDVSFISLRLVIPALLPLLDQQATLIALIKPQFEAGRSNVGKGGVVRDIAVRESVCKTIADFCQGLGFLIRGTTPSPILGPKGNEEFLMCGELAVSTQP